MIMLLIFFLLLCCRKDTILFRICKIMTRNEALNHYLSSLSTKERIAKSRDIREKLEISLSVLCDWRRGRTPLKRVYFDKIIEIVGVDLNIYVDK